MKGLILGLMMVSGTAFADTLVQLPNPRIPPTIVNPHWMHCASIGFSPDHSIYGTCQVSYSSCSGRYCHSPSLFFDVKWAADGSTPVQGEYCGSIAAGVGPAKMSYAAGHSAADCSVKYDPTGTVVMIDGTEPFYYVTTDPVTGLELVDSNVVSYLYTP
jgi:hypothetical protein